MSRQRGRRYGGATSEEVVKEVKVVNAPKTASPVWILTKAFLFTKFVLITVLLLVPKQYDTSSQLIIRPPRPVVWEFSLNGVYSMLDHVVICIVRKLTIWDSVYFTALAKRGVLYEQEWAFGRFWWLTIREISGVFSSSDSIETYALTSIVLSNVSHYLSVLLIYKLTLEMFPLRGKRFAQITGILYVLSPAGIFLVAGYTESTFALLSFVGLLLREKRQYIPSGLVFALSCGYRSNGLLWGILFLCDLYDNVHHFVFKVFIPLFNRNYRGVGDMISIVHDSVRTGKKQLVQSVEIILSGLLIALVFVSLQAYGYYVYCTGSTSPPWCYYKIPSIFSYVQSKYWGVGFLRYWTPNNIPNFLFALPTFYIIWKSSKEIITNKNFMNPIGRIKVEAAATTTPSTSPSTSKLTPYILVQSTIALSALFIWHVQIITRVATCLPAVYWFTAHLITSNSLREVKLGHKITTIAIMWIIAQTILFSAFLPPA